MITSNLKSGINFSDCSPKITNCTIASNDSMGGIYCLSGTAEITDCIIWNNNPCQVFIGERGSARLEYCDIEGGWSGAGSNNIDLDPLFVKGPLHDFYLSHLETGQAAESPCIDAGSDTAENLGLDELSTRTDGMPDEGIVDMGYHAPYALWIDSITKSGNNIMIHWNARPGVSYVVEWCYDLEMWHGFGVGEVSEVMDYGGGLLPEVYYRVREE